MTTREKAKNQVVEYVFSRLTCMGKYPGQTDADYEADMMSIMEDGVNTTQTDIRVPISFDRNGYTTEWAIVGTLSMDAEDFSGLPTLLAARKFTWLSEIAAKWLAEQTAVASR